MPPPKRRKVAFSDEIDDENSLPHDIPSSSGIIDWRDKAFSVKERLQHALKEDHLTDITFYVGPEKTTFHGHKILLSLASPVFEAMFNGSLKETGGAIDLPDVTPQGFKLLLDFIYTDDLKLNNEKDALSSWYVAEKYCLSHMKNRCVKYLTKCEINCSNIWDLLETSQILNAKSLSLRCFDFLEHNLKDAMDTASFLEISTETIEKILHMPNLHIKEDFLLRGIVKWVKEQAKNDSEKSLEDLLKPFMGLIRMGCITQSEFVDFITDHPDIISESDALVILKHMITPVRYSLPAWCCPTVTPRGISSSSIMKQNRKNLMTYVLKSKNQRGPEYSSLNEILTEYDDAHQVYTSRNVPHDEENYENSVEVISDSSESDSDDSIDDNAAYQSPPSSSSFSDSSNYSLT